MRLILVIIIEINILGECMEVVKGVPYFSKIKQKCKAYPYLKKDIETEILIVGGGIDGAIANYYLSQKYDCTLVEKERIGYGSTSCATVLLEYQLDDFAHDLRGEMSDEEIVSVYNMGIDSIAEISDLIEKLGNKCHFSKRPSMLFSSKITDILAIKREYAFRLKNKFNVKYINEENNPFPFDVRTGILAPDGGAEFNAYLFTKQLIEASSNQSKIYENTKVSEVQLIDGKYNVLTSYGERVITDKIVYATGFNFEQMPSEKLCERFVTYTIVTKPIDGLEWQDNALMQDCAKPYHYFRLLPDNRIVFGGEDTPYKDDIIDEKLAEKKYKKLEKDLINLLKKYENKIHVDCAFCGLFGQTKNNLGLIGEGEHRDIFYFTSCGANGIVNAICGSKIIDDIIQKRDNSMEKLFKPTRYMHS